MDNLGKARALAVLVPAVLLGGAYVSQYGFGLYPCEMCWWQRYPHFAALGLGIAAYWLKPPQVWTALAGLAILTSGLIGGFHAGVEYHWWEGITACTAPASGVNVLDFNAAPLIRCDVAPWTLFGISLAGFNFLISSLAGAAIVALAAYRK
ncbi:disulfide bond formation protein B [Porphyrobacter sp. ULC335]|jgi:disulfide bond formation protein DsbB|uniref:disulfide bond formation protein B n=1 Tax=Porphyrobacter sp. ULC335 TaxID=2854260 RepID=UPI00221FB503|nr:disulfide bond formation protein B [Porphyrobacter sp. ULC335]UYV16228.1 disulfide bond formation protein B [Porphyrobacter sp. ULC335]